MKRGSEDHEETMLRISQFYYEQDLTQEDIARRLHLTRWKVGRLLDEARRTGLVRIEIVHPRARRHSEERVLTEAYRLRHAVVVPAGADEGSSRDTVAHAAADFLAALRPSPKVLGVSWGRTLDGVAAHIAPGWSRGVHVVQLNGGLSRSRTPTSAANVAARIAERGCGTATLLPAPAIVEKPATRRTLEKEPAVGDALASARNADLLIFSVGELSARSVLVESGYLSQDDMAALRAAGACGDVLGHFVDRDGRAVDPALEKRTVGLTLDDLRRARCAVAVASGTAKRDAVRAALTSGLCTGLVTDEHTAHFLMEES